MSDFILEEMYDEDTSRGDFDDGMKKSVDTPNTSELKPCPFCGNTPMRTSNHTVLCQTCNREVLPEVWQTRPGEDALRARAERAEAMVERLIEAISILDALAAEWRGG